MTEKKVWVEPKLIVLVRNRPEEAVLSDCKAISAAAGNAAWVDNCMYPCGIGCEGLFGS
jgi:hypothetical protein